METKKSEFNPFDRVLVRDSDDEKWRAYLYSHKNSNHREYYHRMVGDVGFTQCIPYEGNEHLLGTTDSPEKPERWKPKDGEMYYCIAWAVSIGFFTVRSHWYSNEPFDTDAWKAGNCFRTEEEAKQVKDRMNEAVSGLMNPNDEGQQRGGGIVWKDTTT